SGMRDVAIAGDLVGRVHDDDALFQLVRQDARRLAQHGGLANTGPTEKENAASTLDDVLDDCHGSEDGAAHPKREADNATRSVPNRRDSVQGSFDARPIVIPKRADALDDMVEILLRYRPIAEDDLSSRESRFWLPTEIKDDFQEVGGQRVAVERFSNMG